jgi:hypothetical protein
MDGKALGVIHFCWALCQDPKDAMRHYHDWLIGYEKTVPEPTIQAVKQLMLQFLSAHQLYPAEFQDHEPTLNQGQFPNPFDFRRGRQVVLDQWLRTILQADSESTVETWDQASTILWLPESQAQLLASCETDQERESLQVLIAKYQDPDIHFKLLKASISTCTPLSSPSPGSI